MEACKAAGISFWKLELSRMPYVVAVSTEMRMARLQNREEVAEMRQRSALYFSSEEESAQNSLFTS